MGCGTIDCGITGNSGIAGIFGITGICGNPVKFMGIFCTSGTNGIGSLKTGAVGITGTCGIAGISIPVKSMSSNFSVSMSLSFSSTSISNNVGLISSKLLMSLMVLLYNNKGLLYQLHV